MDDDVLLDAYRDTLEKLQYAINSMDLEEGCFTFPDGDTWWQTKHHKAENGYALQEET